MHSILTRAKNNYSVFMYMKIFIDTSDNELKNIYLSSIYKHNNNMINNSFPDAGFDLYLPDDMLCIPSIVNKINFKVKCSAVINYESGKTQNSGFYLYPRSSLSKTPMRLANSVGIIDSGYRGNLIGAFDCIDNDNFINYNFNKYDKFVQICSPGLVPIIIELVDKESDLGDKTDRGDGGFGSTTNFLVNTPKELINGI
jgi:dUTP pyrophosphatase